MQVVGITCSTKNQHSDVGRVMWDKQTKSLSMLMPVNNVTYYVRNKKYLNNVKLKISLRQPTLKSLSVAF